MVYLLFCGGARDQFRGLRSALTLLLERLSFQVLNTLKEYIFRNKSGDMTCFVPNFVFVYLTLLLREDTSLHSSRHPLCNVLVAKTRSRLWILGTHERSIIKALISKSIILQSS